MEVKSQRLDITHLPRAHDGSFGVLRVALVKAFNYSRSYPRKMTALKALCKYVYTRINEFEKYEAAMTAHLAEKAEAEAKAKAEAEQAAEEAQKQAELEAAQALVDAAKQAENEAGKGSEATKVE